MDKLDIRQIILFLANVPSNSSLRLMLQLALASDVPQEKLQLIEQKIAEGASLTDLLKQENLLITLLEADGEIGEAEENMLYETIEQIGIVAPTDISGAKYLLETLTEQIVEEIEA